MTSEGVFAVDRSGYPNGGVVYTEPEHEGGGREATGWELWAGRERERSGSDALGWVFGHRRGRTPPGSPVQAHVVLQQASHRPSVQLRVVPFGVAGRCGATASG